MRLIDADTLRISAIKATDNSELAFDNCYPYWQFSECIKKAPTIDAVPVVRGEWIDGRKYVNSGWRVCSICHEIANRPCGGDNYCPKCGAKMEKEEVCSSLQSQDDCQG